MSLLQLVKQRHSVRKYANKTVEPEKLNRILEAGRVAPTALNKQPQRFLVIDTYDARRLGRGGGIMLDYLV